MNLAKPLKKSGNSGELGELVLLTHASPPLSTRKLAFSPVGPRVGRGRAISAHFLALFERYNLRGFTGRGNQLHGLNQWKRLRISVEPSEAQEMPYQALHRLLIASEPFQATYEALSKRGRGLRLKAPLLTPVSVQRSALR